MPEINHWHFEFIFKPAYYRLGAMHCSLGLFKLMKYPPEGEIVQRHHYKGVWLRFDFNLPGWGFARNWRTWNEVKAELKGNKPVIGIDFGSEDGDESVMVDGEEQPDGTVHIKGIKKL